MTANYARNIRLAMVCARARPLVGGIETHVHEVCSRLADQGVEVTVLTTDRSGILPRLETPARYRVRRWPAYPRSRDYYLAPGLGQHLMQAADYDMVHIQGVHTLVPPMALAAAQRAGIRSVLTFHSGGHSSPLRSSLRGLQWRLMRPLLRSATALVAVSEYEQRTFASLIGVPAEDIRLIRNGSEPLPIDIDAARPEGSPLLVSVGRLERYKGHHRVLQALPAILAQAPHARLVVIGSGPYEPALRAMAHRLGVADRVSICGFGPERRSEMGKLVADADVMCLLSEYEAHPVAVMEALGAGTRSLVADTSGLSELGRAGLVTTIALEASAQQIANAALAVAATPPCPPPKLPSWDDCAAQLLCLYRQVAA